MTPPCAVTIPTVSTLVTSSYVKVLIDTSPRKLPVVPVTNPTTVFGVPDNLMQCLDPQMKLVTPVTTKPPGNVGASPPLSPVISPVRILPLVESDFLLWIDPKYRLNHLHQQ